MSNWKLHTPNGVNDILPDECAVKKEIESTIWSVFSSIGYKEVETPTFEYYDCYLGLSGQISQEHMFKFFDEQGRILALRPDFTTSIARMAATKVANSDKPQRYLYTGNVYRVEACLNLHKAVSSLSAHTHLPQTLKLFQQLWRLFLR